MTQMFGNIQLNENLTTYEYRVMYFFGCWMTAQKIYAENDAEALFDAQDVAMKADLRYALFCGNRKVKELKTPTWNDGCNA